MRSSTPLRTELRTDHLLSLVDDVGIVQHAYGTIPNRSTGYCVDDVARLLIAVLQLERGCSDRIYRRMFASGLAFLFHAWDWEVGGMHNLMDYDRRWLDQPEGGDHVGRAAWALGAVVADDPARPEAAQCLRLLTEMRPSLEAASTPREVAYALLGLTRPEISVLPESLHGLLATLADRLSIWYDKNRRDDWLWFELSLTYDNARLSQALIAAGARLGNRELLDKGLEALDWYADQCTVDDDVIRLVGNRWRHADEPTPPDDEGDEQPLDAAALVEALIEASIHTGRAEYGRRAVHTFEWFLGRNTSGVAVYDFASGGCHDGLGPEGLNENEGAESTLAFLQALLALESAGLQTFIMRPE